MSNVYERRTSSAERMLLILLQKHALPLRTIIKQFVESNGIERFETQCRRIAQETLIERHVFAC
jgi:hypothetical protein